MEKKRLRRLLDNSFQIILKLHLLDGDDQDVDVGDPADELQISAAPLGHGSLVEDAEGKLVAQVRDMLDPANITKKCHFTLTDSD